MNENKNKDYAQESHEECYTIQNRNKVGSYNEEEKYGEIKAETEIMKISIDENHFWEDVIENLIDDVNEENKHVSENSKEENISKKKANGNSQRLWNIEEDISINDFESIKFLGNGAYGKVNLAKWKLNSKEYALKILNKARVQKYDKVENVFREKDIMFELNHPNIWRLEWVFQDPASL